MGRDGWVENQGIRLHYLDSDGENAATFVPVVLIPGFLGSAVDLEREMASLAPRRCIAVSLRGRGRSEAPRAGYSFADHVKDIEAIIRHLGLESVCLLALSTSVAYAIGYTARYPRLLRGLVIADYPARYPAISQEFVEKVLSGSPELALKPHVLRALQRESEEVPLWDSLEQITCPVLLLHGGRPGSHLTAETVAMYRGYLPDVHVVEFSDSGHELWIDYKRFIGTIKAFLERIDSVTA